MQTDTAKILKSAERVIAMMFLKITPVRNVLISKCCFRSERPDMFYNKIVSEGSRIDVFDVSDRKLKALAVTEINKRNHRMIINNKKYFICSINAG